MADTEMAVWWDMFRHANPIGAGGLRTFHQWPDGRPYTEQPAVLVSMFEVLGDVWLTLYGQR